MSNGFISLCKTDFMMEGDAPEINATPLSLTVIGTLFVLPLTFQNTIFGHS